MIVRCERCRAVYALASARSAIAVECSSCGNVFVARSVSTFELGGRYGGAAANRIDSGVWAPATASRAGYSRRRRRRRPWYVAVAMGVVASLVVAWIMRGPFSTRFAHDALDAEIAPLWPAIQADDAVGLERAMARLDAWVLAHPDDAHGLATSAFVIALAALDWGAEADDTEVEIARASLSKTARDDLRRRIAPARATADRWLLRAETRAQQAIALVPESRALEALQLVAAARGDRAGYDRWSAELAASDPWRVYARHHLAVKVGETPDDEALQRASAADPAWLRWPFELARGRVRSASGAIEGEAMRAFSKAHPANAAARRWVRWIGPQP